MNLIPETESDLTTCVLQRLSADPRKLDDMQRACLTLAGAKERAQWLLDRDPALGNEFDAGQLGGLLLHRARSGVGTFRNMMPFVGKQ